MASEATKALNKANLEAAGRTSSASYTNPNLTGVGSSTPTASSAPSNFVSTNPHDAVDYNPRTDPTSSAYNQATPTSPVTSPVASPTTPTTPTTAPNQAQINPANAPLPPNVSTPQVNPVGQTNYDKALADAQKYNAGLAAAKASGKPSPQSTGGGAAMVAGAMPAENQQYVPPPEVQSDLDKTISAYTQAVAQFVNPDNQRASLVQEYDALSKDLGITGLKSELLDINRIMDGTEDDIRSEVTAASGFATESQVQAMTIGRNKTLLKKAQYISDQLTAAKDELNMKINLSSQDRQYAQSQMTAGLNAMGNLVQVQQSMHKAAQDNYNNIIQRQGYDGLLAMAGGNPYNIQLAERTMGLQPGGLKQLATLDANNRAREQAHADLQNQVLESQLKTDVIQRNKLRGLYDAPSSPTETIANLGAYASNYADTGKLPSPAELKQSGLNVGQVTSYAKQLPKPNGALVSTNTGVKSSSLNADEEAGAAALYELVNSTLPKLKEVFPKLHAGFLGGATSLVYKTQNRQDYDTARQEFLSKLLLARSGKVVSPAEYDRYAALVPEDYSLNPFSTLNPFTSSNGQKKITSLEGSIKASLDNTLSSKQLSIYGYSKVNVNGTPRTVGEILDIGGTQYKVLPDGTLTDIL
jgi:hypothetical protein